MDGSVPVEKRRRTQKTLKETTGRAAMIRRMKRKCKLIPPDFYNFLITKALVYEFVLNDYFSSSIIVRITASRSTVHD